jgi:hypothetical protein
MSNDNPDVRRFTRRLDHSVPDFRQSEVDVKGADVRQLTRRLDHSVPDFRKTDEG